MFQSGGGGMWPAGGAGQPNNPTWPSGGGSNPGAGGWPSGPSGGGSNPGPGGWQSGGGSNPAPGGWPSAPQGGGSNPAPGGWPSAPQGGGSNPAPGGWPSAPQGGGSNPAPGGWPSAPQGGGSYPTPGGWPSGPNAPAAPSSRKEMRVPYTDTLLNGVYDKLLITIAGTIKSNPQKFTVDLCKGRDIAFHFNPRFNDNGRQVIVMNTFNGGRWGQEQRESRFPFSSGQRFEMKILCTSSEYKVAVNGSHLVAYRHRITDLRAINSIGIHFDLDLTNVKMETLP